MDNSICIVKVRAVRPSSLCISISNSSFSITLYPHHFTPLCAMILGVVVVVLRSIMPTSIISLCLVHSYFSSTRSCVDFFYMKNIKLF